MTADTTRREHSGSGIRLGIGSCPGIAKILPAGIRGIRPFLFLEEGPFVIAQVVHKIGRASCRERVYVLV